MPTHPRQRVHLACSKWVEVGLTLSHFLDTELHFTGNSFSTSVFKKPGKLTVHWSSQVPKNWKKNAILTSLHRVKRIASSWESEVRKIKETFSKAGYPMWFIDKTVNEFTRPALNQETILPTQWFDDRKSITHEIPFCKRREFLHPRPLEISHFLANPQNSISL